MTTTPPGGAFSPHTDQTGSPRKVYRSSTNRMLFGVCGGIGEYLGIDPTLIRVVWILSLFIAGSGILAYIIGAIIIPDEPNYKAPAEIVPKESSSRIGVLVGIVLIFIAVIYLSNSLSWYRQFPPFHLWHFRFQLLGPLVLISVGALLILLYFRKELPAFPPFEGRVLLRSQKDRKILGICGGLGNYFNLDSTLIRVFWVFFTIATGFIIGVVMYILCFILIREEAAIQNPVSYSPEQPPENTVKNEPSETNL